MCVFSVSKRRRSWILGQAVSLWAGVLCNHTHTNTLRTATSSPGQDAEEEPAPPLPIHTPTHSSLIAFRVPPLFPSFEQQGGGAGIDGFLTFYITHEEDGPSGYLPSHCWPCAALPGSLPSYPISRAPPDRSVPLFL